MTIIQTVPVILEKLEGSMVDIGGSNFGTSVGIVRFGFSLLL